MAPRNWTNNGGIALSAANLNSLEADLDTALGVPDAALANRVKAGATKTALDAAYASTTAVSGKVSKGAFVLFMDDYAGAGDGTPAGTTALQQAFTDAQGKTLVLGKQKTYIIPAGTMITAAKDMTLVSNGSKFLKAAAGGTFGIRTDDGFQADFLWLETPGSASTNDTGVYVLGNNVHIQGLKVVSTQGDTPGLNGVVIGNASAVSATAKTNVRIDRMEVIGWQRPVRILNLADSCIANIDIRNFIVGVYLQNNVSNVNFPRATISGTSAASAGGPFNGMNGLLIEAQADFNTINLDFYRWLVDGAPEHSFRMGGSYSLADITYTNCVSRNPGNAPGNVSTGGGAFKALGYPAHFHKNIRYVNCTAQDSNTNGNGINNFSQFSFGYVDGLTLINPTVRARNNVYSAQIAMFMNATKNVQVVNPDFRDTKTFAVFFGKDGTNVDGEGVTNVKVTGGFVHSAGTHAIYMAPDTVTVKNIYLDNVTIIGNTTTARGMRCEAIGTGGAYVNCVTRVNYEQNATAGTEPPLITPAAGMILHYQGPLYGYTMSADNGSTMVDTTNGAFKIRKAGNWVAL